MSDDVKTWTATASGGVLPATTKTITVPGGSVLSISYVVFLASPVIPAPILDATLTAGSKSESATLVPSTSASVLVGARPPRYARIPWPERPPQPSSLAVPPRSVATDARGRPLGGATVAIVNGISCALALPPPPPNPPQPQLGNQPVYVISISTPQTPAPDGVYTFVASVAPA